jgi:hypothetical protein
VSSEAPLIYREEVLTIMGVIGDINVNLARLLRIAEDDDGEEEANDD